MPQASQGPRNQRTAHELEQFTRLLINGDRLGCRDFLREFLSSGRDAHEALAQLAWPACASVDELSRQDKLGSVHEHAALVLLAQLVQRLECGLEKRPSRGISVIVASGRSASEELAAEIFAGIAEADGFDVIFLGGGVESDDLFREVSDRRPGFVISFAGAGADAPRLRRLIDSVRRQDPVPGLRIGVGGGVFGRVPGLADEIGAHFNADSPFDMLEALQGEAARPTGLRLDPARKGPERRAKAA